MDRRVNIDLVRDMIIKTQEFGIDTGTFIMVGYPTETEEDIAQTVQYLKDANPTNFTITVAYPIKGTGLYEQVLSKITTQLNWHESTDCFILFNARNQMITKSYFYRMPKAATDSANYNLIAPQSEY